MSLVGEVSSHDFGDGVIVRVRRIAGSLWIFWRWPDAVAAYRDQPGQPPQLTHYLPKEN